MKHPLDRILSDLPTAHLASFARAVGAGWVDGSSPVAAFVPFAGGAAEALREWTQDLETRGFGAEQTERLVHAVVSGRDRDRLLLPELVVSGPDVAGVPTADTHAVVQSLFQEAEHEIVLAGYAFHNGAALFSGLAERMKAMPGLKLLFHIDVPRRPNDSSSAEAVVMRAAHEFRERHWPWQPLPSIYFDPRALEANAAQRASLHAKVVVIDRRKLLLTSANFTGAAQERNVEMGLLCSLPHLAERVCAYFEGLRNGGILRPLP